jgi:hypothetical protein
MEEKHMILMEFVADILAGEWDLIDDNTLAHLLDAITARGDDPHDYVGLSDRITKAPHTLRVWDEGNSEEYDVAGDDDFAALAEEEWSKGDWGEGDWRITYRWEVRNVLGEIIDSGEGDITHDRDAPECPEADDHEWTSEFEGGLRENPGVWSLGGTRMLFISRCRHCGMEHKQYTIGAQANPGECDTNEYSAPDPAWVKEHQES